MNELRPLLTPESIAILGASPDAGKVNGRPLRFLLEKGYSGRIFPVNPKYDRIGSLRCYPDIGSLPEAVDLAVVALPARMVAGAVRDLGRRGVRSAVVFSSGFAETGKAGQALEDEVTAAARDAGLRLCGPNCLGLVNAFDRVTATFSQFAEGDLTPGPVAFVTQSGAFGTAIAALARRRGLGLGYFVNTGNEGDVTFAEVMHAVLGDPRIRVGAGYLEGVKNGTALVALAQEALALGKPLVLTKVGRTGSGARAAVSHTGMLAGADQVFDGVIRQHGILRARNEEQMLDLIEVLACCEPARGNGLGIVTQSGGAGVLMCDRAEELGLRVPVLAPETQRALKAAIPDFGSIGNPVDVTGQSVADPRLLGESVRIVLADPQIHVAIVWLQLMEAHAERLVALFEEIRADATKPLVVCWLAAPERALRALRERGIAVLRGGEPAVDACAALVRYGEARRAHAGRGEARRNARLELPSASGILGTVAARSILEAAGVRTAPVLAACDAAEAVAAAERLGYPVAVKVESPDIPHKTEAQGVRLGLADAASVRKAFEETMVAVRRWRHDARIAGVVVQKMAAGSVELVVGLKHDPAFGPIVMAGMGGVHVEATGDVAFRRAPVTRAQALAMLDELRAGAVLNGVRGRAPVDREALAQLICAASELGAAAGHRLKECDLNPVLAGPEGALAVDWLMVLD
ncbi:MAG: acetate--CoA ligase family protein [Betaproteobacteria bacterium]|nr:acetate--CoA ligase family protein [Betaproteobacteria bacterium]